MGSSDGLTAFRWSSTSRAVALAGVVAILPALLSACRSAHASSDNDLPFYSTPTFTAEWIEPSARASRDIHQIAPFSFTDQDGREVTQDSLRGKIYVANFFFTSCPSLCPKMAATLKQIQAAFEHDADVELVSHSVDPSNDTPSRLAAYARKNGVQSGKWHLVTGDQAAIYSLARTSYFAEKQLGLTKTPNEFLHTENMLLVDRNGHLRGVYNATLAAEAIRVIEDIRLLKASK